MGTNEKFCLRWNDFESNISLAFREIREEKDFFDCTLSCGSRQLQAHKIILSACSPFFRSVLKQNPHQHPLLYLKGVTFTDLQAVLNFMYHGEVNIAQEELNSFLAVAEELQVKGLTQNNPPPSSTPRQQKAAQQEDSTKNKHHPGQGSRQPPATAQPVYQPDQEEVEEVPHLAAVKIEPQQAAPFTQDTAVRPGGYHHQEKTIPDNIGMEVVPSYHEEGYDDYGDYEGQAYQGGHGQHFTEQDFGQTELTTGQKDLDRDIDSQIDKYILNINNEWTCTECGKSVKNRVHLRNHIEAQHIVTPGFPCDICGFVSKTRPALRGHKDYNHRIKM